MGIGNITGPAQRAATKKAQKAARVARALKEQEDIAKLKAQKEAKAVEKEEPQDVEITDSTDESLILDNASVYPDGAGPIQKIGQVTSNIVKAVKDKVIKAPYQGAKKAVAGHLGGETQIKAGTMQIAKDEIKPKVTFHSATENFKTNLNTSLENMETKFKEDFALHNLTSPLEPDRILGKMEKLVNDFHSEKGLPFVKELDDVVKGLRMGETTPTVALRKLRTAIASLKHKGRIGQGDTALQNAPSSLSRYEKEVRQIFRDEAKLVGKETGDSKLTKTLLDMDDRFSEFMKMKSSEKSLFKATEKGSEAHKFLTNVQTNYKRSPFLVDEFEQKMLKLEKITGEEGFASRQMDALRDSLGSHLFEGKSGNTFVNYLTDDSGLKTLKKLWPDHAKGFNAWRSILKNTEHLSGNMGGWVAKVFGMSIGGGIGGKLGSGFGSVVAGAAGALGAARLFSNPSFQRWSAKQFSKKPLEPGLALTALTKITGDQAKAIRILDSMKGYATVGGASLYGKGAYDEHQTGVIEDTFQQNQMDLGIIPKRVKREDFSDEEVETIESSFEDSLKFLGI